MGVDLNVRVSVSVRVARKGWGLQLESCGGEAPWMMVSV